MYSQARIKKIINSISDINGSIRVLTDEEIKLLKDKFSQIESWKDAAITKLLEIDYLLSQAKAKLIDHEKRIKELEDAIK